MGESGVILSTDRKEFITCNVNAEQIAIPNGVERIGNYAFENCKKLKYIDIPESVTEIGRSAFEGCTALVSVVLPQNLKRIGKYTFSDCSGLIQIVIPESVEEIEEGTFLGCTGLKSVRFTGTIKRIGKYAFLSCCNLKQINYTHDFSNCSVGHNAFHNTEFVGKTSTDGNKVVYFKSKDTNLANLPNRNYYMLKDNIELFRNPLNVFSGVYYKEEDTFYKAEITKETNKIYSLLIHRQLTVTELINEFNSGADDNSGVIEKLIERMFSELSPFGITKLLHEINYLEPNIFYESRYSETFVSEIHTALFSDLSISCSMNDFDKVCVLQYLGNKLFIKGYRDIEDIREHVNVKNLLAWLQENNEAFEKIFRKNRGK